MKNSIVASILCVALAGRVSGETQQTEHRVVLIDLSPSMKPFRVQQLEAVKKVIQTWEPRQTVDFLAVENNPLGRPPLGHMAAFLYDPTRSNPTRYRLESAKLREQYLATILPAVERAITAEYEKKQETESKPGRNLLARRPRSRGAVIPACCQPVARATAAL